MTLYQFNAADELEQIEAFWNGVLIGQRTEGKFLYECRQIDSFYVEYKKDTEIGMYVDMKSFKNPDLLHFYLKDMDNPLQNS